MADRPRRNSRARELAIRDPLTGALSRAGLADRLAFEVDQARRASGQVSLCVFDLDHFKSINDAYGHRARRSGAGRTGGPVRRRLRSGDLLFRYGGDEFVLLLPQTGKLAAVTLAQKCLTAVRARAFAGEPPLALSVSLGLATWPDDATDGAALFAVADQRQYEAKRRGRGLAVVTIRAARRRPRSGSPARLIERDAALAGLHHFLERLPQARRGVLAILGPAGAGRSGLLHEAASAARLRGYAVLVLRGGLAPEPYAALPAADWPGGLRSPPGRRPSSLRQPPAHGQTTGLLVAADDWPGLDRATRNLLRHLFAEGGPACAGLIFTDLPGGPHPLGWTSRRCRCAKPSNWSRSHARAYASGFAASCTGSHPKRFSTGSWPRPAACPPRFRTVSPIWWTTEYLAAARQRSGCSTRLTAHWRAPGGCAAVPVRRPGIICPVPLTDLVGREADCQQVEALLDRHRLVTLVGPGGDRQDTASLAGGRGPRGRVPRRRALRGPGRRGRPGSAAGAHRRGAGRGR